MAKEPCDYDACLLRFKVIEEKLNEMHDDFRKLEGRVMNGLTERIFEVEKQMAINSVDRTRKEKIMLIWQTAIISTVVAICVALGSFLVTEYVKKQESKKPGVVTHP